MVSRRRCRSFAVGLKIPGARGFAKFSQFSVLTADLGIKVLEEYGMADTKTRYDKLVILYEVMGNISIGQIYVQSLQSY